MGVAGRDYMRDRPTGGLVPGGLSVNTKLILANVVVWFVFAGSRSWGGTDGGFHRFLWDTFLLHPDDVFGKLRLWQPFTAMWFHDPNGLDHLFFNMLFLFFFGRPTEQMLGGRVYFRLYVFAGLASTLALLVWSLAVGQHAPGLGASGAVYGVGVFLALRAPNMPVYFFFVRMPLWVLVGVFMVGREVANLAVLQHGVGATIAHLAGAAYGLLAHRRLGRAPPAIDEGLLAGLKRRRARRQERREAVSEEETRARVDALLEKIHREGIGALSAEEKDFLERASQRFGR